MCVFFINLRFTGSSEDATGVAGRFGDFIIKRFFANTFCCGSVRFSPLLELGTPGVIVLSSSSSCISSYSSGSALGSSFSSSGSSGA